MDERKLRRENVMKVVRSIFELAVILAVIVFVLLLSVYLPLFTMYDSVA